MDKRYRATLTVSAEFAPDYADAIESFSQSLNLFEADPDGAEWQIEAILAQDHDRQGLANALSLLAAAHGVAPALAVMPLPDEDWLRKVAQDFPPRRIGRFFLHGSHYAPQPGEGPLRLQVDAGTAFGSGEHPTTEGCLRALQDLAKQKFKNRHCEDQRDAAIHGGQNGLPRFARNDEFFDMRILDMGCGSGILSLGAARLWPNVAITAIDIDPEAVRVTRTNAAINGVTRRIRAGAGNGYAAPLMARQARFDLIVSNILARPLRRMAPSLATRLKPGGHAILSGLLTRQQAAVIAAHRVQGLHLVRRYTIGDWTTLVMKK